MQGPGFQDRFANSDAIPHFAKNGTALTQEERAAIAKRKGLCVQCGQKTHVISVFKKAPLTNDDVHKGICIKCHPTSVPPKVLQDYEFRNPRVNAPVVPRFTTKPAARTIKQTRADARHNNPLAASLSSGMDHGSLGIPADIGSSHSSTLHSSMNFMHGSSGSSSSKPSAPSSKKLAAKSSLPRKVQSSNNHASSLAGLGRGKRHNSERPGLDHEDSLLASSLSSAPLSHNLSGSGESLNYEHSFVNSSSGGSVSSGMTGMSMRRQNTQVQEDYTGNVNKPSDVDIDELLDTLKAERANADNLKQTLHRIRNFGYAEDPRACMIEIQDLMDQYNNDARVMAIACSALWRLAAGARSLKIEAADNGTIESIIDALRKDHNIEDTDFVQWAVGCLASLADAQDVKIFLAKIGGIEVIVDVLNRNIHSAGVFEWGARALHNLVFQRAGGDDISADIAKNLSSIEEANGIAALVSSMKQHPSEATAQRWAMRLLWKLQDQDNEDVVTRVLKKMKDDGFVRAAVKILKARSTEAETDLFRLSAELMCNILLVSDRDESAFRDAADCMTTIARSLKEDASEKGAIKHAVKIESCCRVVATLMNGTEYSRELVNEACGVQAVLEAIEESPDNLMLLQNGVWAFWALSAHGEREEAFLVKAVHSIYQTVESQLEHSEDLLLPACGFLGSMCIVPGIKAENIPIVAIVHALLSVEDTLVLKEAERAVSNFCTAFPDQVDLVVDAFNIEHLQEVLQSTDFSPTMCGVIASVASKSDMARGRMGGIITPVVAKLDEQENPFMTRPYLELLGTLVISGNQKSTRLPDDIVLVILAIIHSSTSNEIKWTCCAVLRNLIISAASPPNMNGLVNTIIELVESQATQEDLKLQACSVLWALTGKYSKQEDQALTDMARCTISILIAYKGDQGPFDYDLLAMAAGALASITSCMIHTNAQISSEDVDEIISVPYTALDFEADRIELYVRILDSIYNLSYVSDAVLIQCGVIVVVIDTMAEFEGCLEVQQFGCAILAVLASTENLQVNLSIVQTDGIDMIVNALALFCDDNVVQSQACKALSHLSIDEESRMLIASLGGLMLLGNTMRANMDTLDLLEGALSAVLSLSADADIELLIESDIIAVVVAVMRHHRTNSQIQEFGMGVLQNISMRNFDSKQTIADVGGIIAVTDCIREFMGSPTVLERAFTTLWSLAVLDENQAIIAECDGINLVVNGMMTAITYEGVQKQGCGCLCTLSSDSRNKGLIQNVGGVDSIVYAMWGHYASEEIQVEACRALSSLAVDALTNEVMIASDGEVNAIISAMRRFPMSERLQEHGCVALRNFLLSADNVDIIKSNEHEVNALVQQAAARFPEACQERASQVLASLG